MEVIILQRKRKRRFIGVSLAALVILLWISSFFSPELAVRRYVMLHLQPIKSMTVEINDKERHDDQRGYLYEVIGYKDIQTGGDLGVFYLKKYGPLWYVSSVGSGN